MVNISFVEAIIACQHNLTLGHPDCFFFATYWAFAYYADSEHQYMIHQNFAPEKVISVQGMDASARAEAHQT
jgi:hypothetical protein